MNPEKHGYKMWKEENKIGSIVKKYQKRMDTAESFGYPLCECNGKIFINIDYHNYTFDDGRVHEGYEINLVHENRAGYWCDLKIYSIESKAVEKNLSKFEKQLLEMWEVFYDLD